MKKLSFLAALFLGVLPVGSFLSSPVAAQGTWIMVYEKTTEMGPGSLGEYLNMGGFSWWVDVKSIVSRAGIVYFNVDMVTLDKRGNIPQGTVYDGYGWSANCATRSIKTAKGDWQPWGEPRNNLFNSVGKFVCN